MVGDSSGHREGSPSKANGNVDSSKRHVADSDRVSAGRPPGDPKEAVTRAAKQGWLDAAQAGALSDLLSRTGVLGFESKRIISVLVINIALETSKDKRAEMVLQLRDYLEGDGLAKDLVPVLSGAFALR